MNQESLSGLVRIINYVRTYLIYIPQLVEDSLLRSCSDTRWCSRVASSDDVRVLRVLLLSLDKHVNVISAKCFFQLRQLRRIRHSLDDTTLSLHLFMCSSQGKSIIVTVSWFAIRRKRPTSCNVSLNLTVQHEWSQNRRRASSTGD